MITYRKDFKLYWPQYDKKADRNFNFIMAHLKDMDYAINNCKEKNVCVQAGGNVGLWPLRLAKHFDWVYTFEPDEPLFECMQHNIKLQNVIMDCKGLSNQNGKAKFHQSSSCGSNRINSLGKYEIETITIDSLELPACDAVFLDIEGHELQAIEGAMDTIQKYRPVIHIEWLKHYEPECEKINRILKKLKYKDRVKSGRDVVYLP